MPHTRGHSLPGGGGNEPPDHPAFSGIVLRTQGLLTLAFGFAMGFAFTIFFVLLRYFNLRFSLNLGEDIVTFLNTTYPNLFWSFLFGSIIGTVLAAIYNLLVTRRLNLFGLESSMDEITR
ncbi:MAG: hypothetical protein E2O87_06745 [Bacteroidetes bacterium]|nr:MAG: hypothetical protein E2O87_06745 [Bacteroidota bacterium]